MHFKNKEEEVEIILRTELQLPLREDSEAANPETRCDRGDKSVRAKPPPPPPHPVVAWKKTSSLSRDRLPVPRPTSASIKLFREGNCIILRVKHVTERRARRAETERLPVVMERDKCELAQSAVCREGL